MKIDVLYFAWVRERVGAPHETIETGARTVGDLMDELRTRGEGHAAAFCDPGAVRAAVDQQLAEPDTAIKGAREVAFFPPMTGG